MRHYIEHHINRCDFGDGSSAPSNWRAIADCLNERIDDRLSEMDFDDPDCERQEAVDEIWEAYWEGSFDDVPEPIYDAT